MHVYNNSNKNKNKNKNNNDNDNDNNNKNNKNNNNNSEVLLGEIIHRPDVPKYVKTNSLRSINDILSSNVQDCEIGRHNSCYQIH